MRKDKRTLRIHDNAHSWRSGKGGGELSEADRLGGRGRNVSESWPSREKNGWVVFTASDALKCDETPELSERAWHHQMVRDLDKGHLCRKLWTETFCRG